jgi:hypothetical protein
MHGMDNIKFAGLFCSVNYSSISLKEGNVMLNLAMQVFEKREFNVFTKMR